MAGMGDLGAMLPSNGMTPAALGRSYRVVAGPARVHGVGNHGKSTETGLQGGDATTITPPLAETATQPATPDEAIDQRDLSEDKLDSLTFFIGPNVQVDERFEGIRSELSAQVRACVEGFNGLGQDINDQRQESRRELDLMRMEFGEHKAQCRRELADMRMAFEHEVSLGGLREQLRNEIRETLEASVEQLKDRLSRQESLRSIRWAELADEVAKGSSASAEGDISSCTTGLSEHGTQANIMATLNEATAELNQKLHDLQQAVAVESGDRAREMCEVTDSVNSLRGMLNRLQDLVVCKVKEAIMSVDGTHSRLDRLSENAKRCRDSLGSDNASMILRPTGSEELDQGWPESSYGVLDEAKTSTQNEALEQMRARLVKELDEAVTSRLLARLEDVAGTAAQEGEQRDARLQQLTFRLEEMAEDVSEIRSQSARHKYADPRMVRQTSATSEASLLPLPAASCKGTAGASWVPAERASLGPKGWLPFGVTPPSASEALDMPPTIQRQPCTVLPKESPLTSPVASPKRHAPVLRLTSDSSELRGPNSRQSHSRAASPTAAAVQPAGVLLPSRMESARRLEEQPPMPHPILPTSPSRPGSRSVSPSPIPVKSSSVHMLRRSPSPQSAALPRSQAGIQVAAAPTLGPGPGVTRLPSSSARLLSTGSSVTTVATTRGTAAQEPSKAGGYTYAGGARAMPAASPENKARESSPRWSR